MRLLHLHPRFGPTGVGRRVARLMQDLGSAVEHAIVSPEPDATAARNAVGGMISPAFPDTFPALEGRPGLRRLERLARAMLGHDLVLTYNWGAIDAVMAHTLFARALGLPPLVHHEDGRGLDQTGALGPVRNWYRRIALGRASALVVPSARIESIALKAWQQPAARVRRIADGVDTQACARAPKPDAIPRVVKRSGELWIGTLAGPKPAEALPNLVRVLARLPDAWQIVAPVEGQDTAAVRAVAMDLGLGHRIHFPRYAGDWAGIVGLFDLLVVASEAGDAAFTVREAMAAGLAIVAPRSGELADTVAPENRPFLVAPAPEDSLAPALESLTGNAGLRARVGAANRARAHAEYGASSMIAALRSTYAEALGRERLP